MKVVLAVLVLIGMLAATARAQPVTGFYVQGSAGVALPQQQSLSQSSPPPASSQVQPTASTPAAAADAAINGDAGGMQSGSAGWGFGNGFRMEMEGVHAAQRDGPGN